MLIVNTRNRTNREYDEISPMKVHVKHLKDHLKINKATTNEVEFFDEETIIYADNYYVKYSRIKGVRTPHLRMTFDPWNHEVGVIKRENYNGHIDSLLVMCNRILYIRESFVTYDLPRQPFFVEEIRGGGIKVLCGLRDFTKIDQVAYRANENTKLIKIPKNMKEFIFVDEYNTIHRLKKGPLHTGRRLKVKINGLFERHKLAKIIQTKETIFKEIKNSKPVKGTAPIKRTTYGKPFGQYMLQD